MLSGTLDTALLNCLALSEIDLTANQLSGAVPEYLATLPNLMLLSLGQNNFTGAIPVLLWRSQTLMEILLADNHLNGEIPPAIGTMTALTFLTLDNNNFSGAIPAEIGQLTNLSVLSLSSNNFSGAIPREVGRCVKLTTLNLENNSLSGTIPREIGNLVNLDYLVLSYNHLEGSIPEEIIADFRTPFFPTSSYVQHHGVLDLSNNHLNGTIPSTIGECVVLVELRLSENELTGVIPPGLSNLTNLTTLDFASNQLHGEIPATLGALQKLQGMNLAFNELTGAIPPELGQIVSLVELNLSNNRLAGSIPETLGNLTGLSHMDLSSNALEGVIPASLSTLVSVVGLTLQQNRFSGTLHGLLSESSVWHQMQHLNLSFNLLSGAIPPTIGNLSGLSSLDLRANHLGGAIPDEIGNLAQVEHLDLSHNHLTGTFPVSLCDLTGLRYLNFSYNLLSGEIPRRGQCVSFSANEFLANGALCGEVVQLACRKQTLGVSVGGILGIALSSLIVVLVVSCGAIRLRQLKQEVEAKDLEKAKLNMNIGSMDPCSFSLDKMKEPLSINVAMFEQPLLRLTLADVLRATNGFSKTNIIGDGGFGTVYKAHLPDGRIVAVKKLGHGLSQGNREFLAEMETLGKVKHRHLVPLLGYCSFGEEKLLVYDYMPNGSLDLWLRNRADALEFLEWPKRFRIALGSARGLCFLHHGFTPHIIHRDIKASNILLDANFEPRVADFGLARLISAYDSHVSTDIAGTFGYIPPEYGQSWRVTTRGDVYSYGVILLELLTGKEPTRDDFKDVEGGNLVGWVRGAIKRGDAPAALDPEVCKVPWKPMMLKVLHIANLCTAEDPVRRPTMLQVVKFLKDIEDLGIV